jgi:DNA-binding transcriptional MerR regulator
VAYTLWSGATARLAHFLGQQVQMSKYATRQQNGPGSPIPDKLYFRIGEVARLCGVEAYVLRFWETEFPQLKPNKSGTGQRLYRKRDVELAFRIKRLLYSEGYTIAGARQVFAAEVREPQKKSQPELPLKRGAEANPVEARLKKLRAEVREILGILSAPPVKRERREKTGLANEAAPGPGLFDS